MVVSPWVAECGAFKTFQSAPGERDLISSVFKADPSLKLGFGEVWRSLAVSLILAEGPRILPSLGQAERQVSFPPAALWGNQASRLSGGSEAATEILQ